MKIKPLLFKIARSRFAEYFIGFAFAHLTRLMPLDRLWESERIIIFKHPVPSWQTHWLGVPKKRLRSFAALNFEDVETQELILAVYEELMKTAVSHNLSSFSILVNGGHYQDVPQIHFHLIAGLTNAGAEWDLDRWMAPGEETAVTHHHNAIAYPHPHSTYQTHHLIQPHLPQTPCCQLDINHAQTRDDLISALSLTQKLIVNLNLRAFRVQLNCEQIICDPIVFHVIQN